MSQRGQPPSACSSPGCFDLLRHVDDPCLPLSPLYLSFFEEECRAIATRLRLGANATAQPSPGAGGDSALWPDAAWPVTSTPLRASPPRDEEASDGAALADRPSTSGCEAAPRLAGREPRSPLQPAAGSCPSTAWPGSRLPRPQARSLKAARRGARQLPCGGPGPAGSLHTSTWSPGRGSGRLSGSRAPASQGLELPKAGRGLGALGTRLPRFPGTKLKLKTAAKSRLQHPNRALMVAQPSTIPKPTPWDTERETAVKVGGCRQPSRKLSTAIHTVASCSRLHPLGKVASPKRFCLGSTTQELMCNRTRELKENNESKERLVATGTVLGAGKADGTFMCVGSFSSELAPAPTRGCEDAVPAEQSAGDQLFQELKRVKNELQRVKGELADKIAQCEVYCQTISSLQAQLRAAGICPEDAAVEKSGDLERD